MIVLNDPIIINTTTVPGLQSRILIIYTGGTFGMMRDDMGVLKTFDFNRIIEYLPVLRRLPLHSTVLSFKHPIDSSNMDPRNWQAIGKIIFENYDMYDGFVVLHGTDTMAYTSSALTYMLPNLAKPIVFTGAQLPISEPRSDARDNLVAALEIASAYEQGKPIMPVVSLYFNYELILGCRAKKNQTMHFEAFRSINYPLLAKAGIKMEYFVNPIKSSPQKKMKLLSHFDTRIVVLKLFPGITENSIRSVIENTDLQALVIETYGSGNAPTYPWFIELLSNAIKRGIIILNISQCLEGRVVQGRYKTSELLNQIGVISGKDMTLEAAVTKLMFLLGEYGKEKTKKLIGIPLAGEMMEG